MGSKGSGKFIVTLADQTSFAPKLVVKVSKSKEGQGKYLLSIHHPNKTEAIKNDKGEDIVDKRTGRKKFVGKVLHEQIVENNNPDEIQAFLEVKAIGDRMIGPPVLENGTYVGGELYHVPTKYQEILFIPAGKKGRAKLKTRKAVENGLEDEVDKDFDENAEIDESVVDMGDEDAIVDELIDDEVVVEKTKSIKSSKKELKVKKEVVKKVKAPKKQPKSKTIKNKVKNNKDKKSSLKSKKKVVVKKNKVKNKKKK